MGDLPPQKRQPEELKLDRAELIKQLRKTQQTIERSHALITRMNELLAKANQKVSRS